MDTGQADTHLVVQTNIAAVLRRQLTGKAWRHESVTIGTSADPYQRAEGRYRLMPGIIRTLADSRTPFSILTKSTLLRRDLPLLAAVAREIEVRPTVSLAILDTELHHSLEPETPSPEARLNLVRTLADAGFTVDVLVSPIIPCLTDSRAQLDAAFAAIAEAGAYSALTFPMHLAGNAREGFLSWLARRHPALLRRYRQLYGRDTSVTPAYSAWLHARTDRLLAEHGLTPSRHAESRSAPETADTPAPQLALFA
nr:radical SAM protein [Nocardia sp. CNY236]